MHLIRLSGPTIPKQNCSRRSNIICNGSPLLITYDSKNFVVSAFWVLLRKYWRGPWPDRHPSIGAKQGVVVAFQQDFDIILVDLDFLDDELEVVPIFLFVNPLYLFLHLFLLEL